MSILFIQPNFTQHIIFIFSFSFAFPFSFFPLFLPIFPLLYDFHSAELSATLEKDT